MRRSAGNLSGNMMTIFKMHSPDSEIKRVLSKINFSMKPKSNSAQLESLLETKQGSELKADVILLELKRRSETVYGKAPEAAIAINVPNNNALLKLESAAILKKKIVGKEDVDIAAMIQKLGNSDWVKQGREFYEANDKVCPFCQQATEDSFANSLNEYFDETFESDTKAIDALYDEYKTNGQSLSQNLQEIITSPSVFLDVNKLKSEKDLLESNIRTNMQRIQKKRDEPSRSVEIDSLSNVLSSVKDVIEEANRKITDHNKMVTNLAREKHNLTAQVWKYLLEYEIKSDLAAYKTKKVGFSTAIERLTEQIKAKQNAMSQKESEIKELEKATSSIQPTIDDINKMLHEFGFTNFTLSKAKKERYYRIVRPDGTDARETLSEGEKNFITFLYFYHLLKGSESESGIMTDRVVVFDDPVCSLDSDILFIVSHLISDIQQEAIKGSSNIKQVFVLTHNVFFPQGSHVCSLGNERRQSWILDCFQTGRSKQDHTI